MSTAAEPLAPDAAELQNLLTRYVDSHEGYHQVAEVIEEPSHASAFREIAERRKMVVDQISGLIIREGKRADLDSSPEAALHRWWIRFRAAVAAEELRVALEECVRGEEELARTATSLVDHGNLKPSHAAAVAALAAEVKEAIQTFKSALNE